MRTLTQIFEQVLQDDNRKYDPNKIPSFKIKPSSLGSPCYRKIYYDSAGVVPDYPFPLDGKKRMALGDAIHDMLHDKFKQAGVLVDYYNPDGSIKKDFNGNDDLEFPIMCSELHVKSGKIDAVYIIDGELWLGEYKSINTKGFTNLMAPKMDHLYQGLLYFYVFNKLLAEGVFSHIKELQGFTAAKGIRFLYIHKDDTSFKEYHYTEADDFFQNIVDKIMTIKDAYDQKSLPPKTKDFCYSCNWRDKCSKNFNIS